VEHAGDRAPMVDQAQSINLFLPANVHKRDLHQLHLQAWKKGVKSLYYCRSLSIQRAERHEAAPAAVPADTPKTVDLPVKTLAEVSREAETADYEECLACQ